MSALAIDMVLRRSPRCAPEFGLAPTRPTSLIDRATDGTITPLAVGYTIYSTLAFAVQYWTTRRHMHRRPFASGPAT